MRAIRFRPWAAVPLIVLFSVAPLAGGRAAEPDTIDELRREFASAGPPNFHAIMQEMSALGGVLTIKKFVATSAVDGVIHSEREERQFRRVGEVQCTTAATATNFFAGLLDVDLTGTSTIRCSSPVGPASPSLRIDSNPAIVTNVEGRLFPLAPGNELRFQLRRDGPALAAALFPNGVTHRLTVVDVLEGATLNVIGGPDIIYLLRDEQTYSKTDQPFRVEIYWSSALRWPIQMRLRSNAKNLTMGETNLVGVAGVGPYALPDGRSSPRLDRTRIAVAADGMEIIAERLKPAMLAEKDEADRETTRRTVGALVGPTAESSSDLRPAFATIAPFVTMRDAFRR